MNQEKDLKKLLLDAKKARKKEEFLLNNEKQYQLIINLLSSKE
jgi:hypothetical protein